MKNATSFIFVFLFSIYGFCQDRRLLFEGSISAAWSSTDVKNETNLGRGFGLGYSFNYDYGRHLGFDVKFRYHQACWHGQDYTLTTLNHLGNNYDGPLKEYKDEIGVVINNFANDAKEFGIEFAVHANRLREKTNFDPYLFGGLSLVKNQAKGDLIHFVGSPTIYEYDQFEMDKESRKHILDGTYESPLEGSLYGERIQLMPGLGIGFVYHFGEIFSIGIEHKTVFTLRDDFDGYIPTNERGVKPTKDFVHYSGIVFRIQPNILNR